ncbi:hypothetical protein VNO77_03751 [Canavalia gladiata]|uniref:Uncharacterized protein n=1 Tax=Canavalia gladiata TaxID=3824 RepID=A0AAN9MVV9_CANGL
MKTQGHSVEGCWKPGCQDKRVEGGRPGRPLLRPMNIRRIDSKSSKRTFLRFRFHIAYEEARLIRRGVRRRGHSLASPCGKQTPPWKSERSPASSRSSATLRAWDVMARIGVLGCERKHSAKIAQKRCDPRWEDDKRRVGCMKPKGRQNPQKGTTQREREKANAMHAVTLW